MGKTDAEYNEIRDMALDFLRKTGNEWAANQLIYEVWQEHETEIIDKNGVAKMVPYTPKLQAQEAVNAIKTVQQSFGIRNSVVDFFSDRGMKVAFEDKQVERVPDKAAQDFQKIIEMFEQALED